MKVSKKSEKLARALVFISLIEIGFPIEKVQSRIDEAWPGQLPKANCIIAGINNIDDSELEGETTQAEMERWCDGSRA